MLAARWRDALASGPLVRELWWGACLFLSHRASACSRVCVLCLALSPSFPPSRSFCPRHPLPPPFSSSPLARLLSSLTSSALLGAFSYCTGSAYLLACLFAYIHCAPFGCVYSACCSLCRVFDFQPSRCFHIVGEWEYDLRVC